MDDGSVLPDVAYLTSAQLGRPFPVRWVNVPERDGQTTSVRKQFTDGRSPAARSSRASTAPTTASTSSTASPSTRADLPADAVKHDGMVWFYSYADQTITLVTYFPHQTSADDRQRRRRYDGVVFDGPDNVTVTPWGTLVLAEDGVGASHVLSSVPGGPTYAIARNQLNIGTRDGPGVLRVHRPDVLRRRQGAVRQHPDAGHHPGDHRPVGEVPLLRHDRASPVRGRRTCRETRRGRPPDELGWAARGPRVGGVLVRQARTVLRRCMAIQISSAMTAPMIEPMMPEGWRNPSSASLWNSR